MLAGISWAMPGLPGDSSEADTLEVFPEWSEESTDAETPLPAPPELEERTEAGTPDATPDVFGAMPAGVLFEGSVEAGLSWACPGLRFELNEAGVLSVVVSDATTRCTLKSRGGVVVSLALRRTSSQPSRLP